MAVLPIFAVFVRLTLGVVGAWAMPAARPPMHALVGPFAQPDGYFRSRGYADCAMQTAGGSAPNGVVECAWGDSDGTVSVSDVRAAQTQFVAIRTARGWYIDPRSLGEPRLSDRVEDRGAVVVEFYDGGCDPPDGCFPSALRAIVVCDARAQPPRCSAPIPLGGYDREPAGDPPAPIRRIGDQVWILGRAFAIR
jgi:hypothetical protein